MKKTIDRFLDTENPKYAAELRKELEGMYARRLSKSRTVVPEDDVCDVASVAYFLLNFVSGSTNEKLEQDISISFQCLVVCFDLLGVGGRMIVTVIQSHPFFEDFLDSVARMISTTSDLLTLTRCLEFTAVVLKQCWGQLYRNESLIDAVVQYSITGSYRHNYDTKHHIMSIMKLLVVGKDHYGVERHTLFLTKFLRMGGLKALVAVTADVLLTRTKCEVQDQGHWETAGDVVKEALDLALDKSHSAVPTELCAVNHECLTVLAPALYQRLQERPEAMLPLVRTFPSLWRNFSFFRLEEDSVYERFLFYAPKKKQKGAKSLLRVYCEAAQACHDGQLPDRALSMIQSIKSEMPLLAARIEEELPERVSGDEDRRCCSFPDCCTAAQDLADIKMMKCARCLAVYYCSKEHQVQHWREHKRACVARTAQSDN